MRFFRRGDVGIAPWRVRPYNLCPVSAAAPRWERIAASLRAAKQVPLGYSSQ